MNKSWQTVKKGEIDQANGKVYYCNISVPVSSSLFNLFSNHNIGYLNCLLFTLFHLLSFNITLWIYLDHQSLLIHSFHSYLSSTLYIYQTLSLSHGHA